MGRLITLRSSIRASHFLNEAEHKNSNFSRSPDHDENDHFEQVYIGISYSNV